MEKQTYTYTFTLKDPKNCDGCPFLLTTPTVERLTWGVTRVCSLFANLENISPFEYGDFAPVGSFMRRPGKCIEILGE